MDKPNLIIDLDRRKNDQPIAISYVMPVFNQERIVCKNLKSLLRNVTMLCELIIIDDGSSDGTLNIVKTVATSLVERFQQLMRIRVYSNRYPLFETCCDHFGISVSEGKYIIEVQADMEIVESGFDMRMRNAISHFDDILMLSGRGTEKVSDILDAYHASLGTDRAYSRGVLLYTLKRILMLLINKVRLLFPCVKYLRMRRRNRKVSTLPEQGPGAEGFESSGRAGNIGGVDAIQTAYDRDKVWLSETSMRGPLIINRERYMAIGGLAVDKFFQGFDDHDLSLRGWIISSLRVGYIPVDYYSPIDDGTTRKERSLKQELQILKNVLRIAKKRRASYLYNARELLLSKPITREVRVFRNTH